MEVQEKNKQANLDHRSVYMIYVLTFHPRMVNKLVFTLGITGMIKCIYLWSQKRCLTASTPSQKEDPSNFRACITYQVLKGTS